MNLTLNIAPILKAQLLMYLTSTRGIEVLAYHGLTGDRSDVDWVFRNRKRQFTNCIFHSQRENLKQKWVPGVLILLIWSKLEREFTRGMDMWSGKLERTSHVWRAGGLAHSIESIPVLQDTAGLISLISSDKPTNFNFKLLLSLRSEYLYNSTNNLIEPMV